MRRRLLWPLAGAAVVVLLVVVWQLIRTSSGPPAPRAFHAVDVRTDSDDIELVVEEVRGDLRPASMVWTCVVVCRESAGCRAEVAVVIHYRSSGRLRHIGLSEVVDAALDERVRLRRVQPNPIAVDRVDSVAIRVVGPADVSGVMPTPEE